jgi:hypothetical protein
MPRIKVIDCKNPIYADFMDDDTEPKCVWVENRELNLYAYGETGVDAAKDFVWKFECITEGYALSDDVYLTENAIVFKRLLRWHLFNEPINI